MGSRIHRSLRNERDDLLIVGIRVRSPSPSPAHTEGET